MAEIKLWLSLDTKGRTLGGQATKIVKSAFTVTPGMMVEDFAWKDALPVKAVYFSTDTPDVLTVFMGRDDADSDSHFRQLVEMYRGHGWTVKVAGESED